MIKYTVLAVTLAFVVVSVAGAVRTACAALYSWCVSPGGRASVFGRILKALRLHFSSPQYCLLCECAVPRGEEAWAAHLHTEKHLEKVRD